MKPWLEALEPFGIYATLVEPGMIRTSFCEAATRVPVSEPYHGGPADRHPIPLEQMKGEPDQGSRQDDRGSAVSAPTAPPLARFRRLWLGHRRLQSETGSLQAATGRRVLDGRLTWAKKVIVQT
jgi:hypothetical protein